MAPRYTSAHSAMSNEAPASSLKVAGVVLFYMVSALVMVFVNKAVLNSSPDLPFTFLFVQLVIAVLLLHALALVVPKSWPLKEKVAIPELNAETAYKLMPVISVGIIALVFNTLCLRSVDASFFQIARGLLLPFTIGVAALQTGLSPRANVLRAAALVTVGFFLGISPSSFFRSSDFPSTGGTIASDSPLGGMGLSVKGLDRDKVVALIYGSLSALMTAIHAVMVKNAVKTLDGSVLRLTYWNNFMSGFFLFPCILLNGEASIFVEKFLVPLAQSSTAPLNAATTALALERSTFLTGSMITGFFGFLLGLAGLLSIKVTSPVTHMVTSASRSVLQTLLGVMLLGEIVTKQRALSIAVITIGAVYYTWIQSSRAPILLPAEDKPQAQARSSNWVRTHGTTQSLATLLPLHTPRPIRAVRLGSISEEEEEYARERDMEERKALLDGSIPEDDLARLEKYRGRSPFRDEEKI